MLLDQTNVKYIIVDVFLHYEKSAEWL